MGVYKGAGLPPPPPPSSVALTGELPAQRVSSGSSGGMGGASRSIVDRAQTFDYGNHSNKALEFTAAAVRELEQEEGYPNKGRWP